MLISMPERRTETARECMVLKEYTLVQKDQAEEVRAA